MNTDRILKRAYMSELEIHNAGGQVLYIELCLKVKHLEIAVKMERLDSALSVLSLGLPFPKSCFKSLDIFTDYNCVCYKHKSYVSA